VVREEVEVDDVDRAPTRIIENVYFKTRIDMPRIAIGVRCRVVNGVTEISAKNVNIGDVNSQYYIRKALYTVYMVRRNKGWEQRTAWDIFIDPAMGATQVQWIRLLKNDDFIYLNVTQPEEQPIEFDSLGDSVRYFSDRINKLTEEHLRLQATLQADIRKLKQEQRKLVTDVLGKHRFVGSLNAVADCLLDNYDSETGEFKPTEYTQCLLNVVAKRKFYRDVAEIQARRRDPVKGKLSTAGNFIDTLTTDKFIYVVDPTKNLISVSPISSSSGSGGSGSGVGRTEGKQENPGLNDDAEVDPSPSDVVVIEPEASSGLPPSPELPAVQGEVPEDLPEPPEEE
jgi:hypothetical protein